MTFDLGSPPVDALLELLLVFEEMDATEGRLFSPAAGSGVAASTSGTPTEHARAAPACRKRRAPRGAVWKCPISAARRVASALQLGAA